VEKVGDIANRIVGGLHLGRELEVINKSLANGMKDINEASDALSSLCREDDLPNAVNVLLRVEVVALELHCEKIQTVIDRLEAMDTRAVQ